MIINTIPEYQSLLREISERKKELQKQRRALNGIKRKLEKLNQKYNFLYKIFQKNIGGKELEELIAEYFKVIGYINIQHITNDNRNADIEIRMKNRLTCIEVKSTNKDCVDENEIFQIVKYKGRREEGLENLEVRGIFILNHNKDIEDLDKRSKNPFDKYREKDANLHNYSLISTLELLNGFRLLKSNKISFEEFDEVIHKKGIVKFSKRAKKMLCAE